MIWKYADFFILDYDELLYTQELQILFCRFQEFPVSDQFECVGIFERGGISCVRGSGGIGLVGLWGPFLTLHLSKVILLTR